MDLISGISAASQALDLVKKLREIDADLKGAEAKLKLADLYGMLADVKIALADAQTELKAKDAEIAHLKEVNEGKLKTFMRNGYKFGIGDDGIPLPRAFCPACLANGQQIMISEGIGGHDLCPKCEGIYSESDVKLPAGFRLPAA
jgi:hypothetical protein